MPEDPYAISDDERSELMEWIGSLEVPTALQKILAKSIDAELIEDAWCSSCGGRVPVRYPDRKGAAAFIKLLFDYKLLKPSDKVPASVTFEHANILVMGPEERQAYKLQLLQQTQRALPSGK